MTLPMPRPVHRVSWQTSGCSMGDSSGFHQLSYGVQRWIYRQGWQSLRAIQEKAIPIILAADHDVLITAPTAGGKTEASFLPIVSWLEKQGPASGYGVLSLSPLKALINDQYGRLELLCESADTSITPWHGDVSTSLKAGSWKSPKGILLTTPESLEAMFVTRSHELKNRLQNLQYVVIDEFHAFISRERGQQLLALLSRLEDLIGHSICRIALSATIGDPVMALNYLRPDSSRPGIHLDVTQESMSLQLVLKSYQPGQKGELPASIDMAKDLFNWLRGGSHLVFANSRRTVEELTDQLGKLCESKGLPLEFFAHHGSLSRDARHFVEQRLKAGELPTTGIATSTLELGLDIGDVESVAQVDAPANVSSVRQRLGRSGRRDGASAILRVLVTGNGERKNASPVDLLEVEIVQTIAVLELILERWVEPPEPRSLHLSTLVQQILSMIAFRGGISAASTYATLCKRGPWRNITPDLFGRVLRGLGQNQVIQQLPSGELIIDRVGEGIVSSHTFFTAFEVPEEYRLVANGRNLGSLPVTTPYVVGQLLLFGGRRWSVENIDVQAKIMTLARAKSGQAPTFGGEPAPVHQKIRQRMLSIYQHDDVPRYCDPVTTELLTRARQYFRERSVASTPFIQDSGHLYWFIWGSDRVLDTIKIATALNGYPADKMGPCVVIQYAGEPEQLVDLVRDYLSGRSPAELGNEIEAQPLGKFDEHLSEDVIKEAFVTEKLDIEGALEYLASLVTHPE